MLGTGGGIAFAGPGVLRRRPLLTPGRLRPGARRPGSSGEAATRDEHEHDGQPHGHENLLPRHGPPSFPSTAPRTASTNWASGTAPSNDTRSLTTVFGTAITM